MARRLRARLVSTLATDGPCAGRFADALRAPLRVTGVYGALGGYSDELSRLFAPDFVVRGQEPTRYAPGAAAERRLMLAVLRAAIHDVHKHTGHWRADARAWIESRDTAWPFAYERICEALGLAADELRDGVLRPAKPVDLAVLAQIDSDTTPLAHRGPRLPYRDYPGNGRVRIGGRLGGLAQPALG